MTIEGPPAELRDFSEHADDVDREARDQIAADWDEAVAAETDQAWAEHLAGETAGDNGDEAATNVPGVFGKRWVVNTDHSWLERTRDSQASFEERSKAKEKDHDAARAERKKLQKNGLKRQHPARDGYLPGQTPRKDSPWNIAIAQNVLLKEHDLLLEDGEGLVPTGSSLLTEDQADVIYSNWDAHDAEMEVAGRITFSAFMAKVFDEGGDEVLQAKAMQEAMDDIGAYLAGMDEAEAHAAAENAAGSQDGVRSESPDPEQSAIEAVDNELEAARRRRDNRLALDGHDSKLHTGDEEALAEAS